MRTGNNLRLFTILLSVAVLFFSLILFTSCNLDSKESDPEPEITDFITHNLAGKDSGLEIYDWKANTPNYEINTPDNEIKNITNVMASFKSYVLGRVNVLENMVKDDPATKEYLSKYLNTVKEQKFDADNFDTTLETIYNLNYVYNNLIATLPTKEDGLKLATSFSIFFNESLGRGGTATDVGYKEKMKYFVKFLKYAGMTATDVDHWLNDIDNNNCKEYFNVVFKPLLTTAVNNLNQTKNINLTTDQVIALMNVSGPVKSMQGFYDILPSHKKHKLVLVLDDSMQDKARAISSTTENTMGR